MQHLHPELFEKIERFIDDYTEMSGGSSPTIIEIGEGIGCSKSTVAKYLTIMKEKGEIQGTGRKSLITKRMQKDSKNPQRIAILGSIACGTPLLAEENIEGYIRMSSSLLGDGSYFILKADGNSMVNADINDGDAVLIRQQSYAEKGQIVVALIGEEATLKRYYPEPENHRIRLQPENDTMDPIYVDDCIIQGIAVKVIKDVSGVLS